ncbi:hypothetical protein ACNQ13_03010 [Mycoplasma sp. VS428]|uniref:hypothetical protein n=1 Tax=Mycoplasma sp. VS428 TaxID=3401684 RepID=UPI003AADBF05
MRRENSWIIFSFLLITFAYIAILTGQFGAILGLSHFNWENKNSAIGNIIYLIDLAFLFATEFLYFIYRVISDFNVQVRLSRKFRNQEFCFKNKTTNKFIGWIYKYVYFKKTDNTEQTNLKVPSLNKSRIKLHIYLVFWCSVVISLLSLIMNISYTAWYCSTNQNAYQAIFIYTIWVYQVFAILWLFYYLHFHTYYYCKKHNLQYEMFDENNHLIRWILDNYSKWPYLHFSTVYNAFGWNDEYK